MLFMGSDCRRAGATLRHVKIRIATPADAPGIRAIYAPVVEHTPISFELEPPDEAEMARRIAATLPQFPWLVAEGEGGTVAGYVYASRHGERRAYQWSVDVSAYVHEAARGRGLGKRLYTLLLRLLREQGHCQAFAGIALPNVASVALHESVGFRPLGVYRDAGYKLGRWHDVGWWQCPLARPEPPPPPRPFDGGRGFSLD
jgi:phosphinothricin acetyltransferase